MWCSARWYYSSPAMSYDADEKGKCCFNKVTAASDRLSGVTANVVTCPAAFTNAAGGSVAASASSFWCSDSAASLELALINCRQREPICGANEMLFANRFEPV